MKICLSVIKADIGSIGGHVAPSRQLIEATRHYVDQRSNDLGLDVHISHTGDDIAILMAQRTASEARRFTNWLGTPSSQAQRSPRTRTLRSRPGLIERIVLGEREGDGAGGCRDGVR